MLDEIQLRPDLFGVFRVLADRSPRRARFLVLGSASPSLLRQGSETLAGRIAFYELPGFSLDEVEAKNWRRLWFRGGFPRSYLARSHRQSGEWRANFVRTFLERDLLDFNVGVPAKTLANFSTMLAHYHGQVWNGSELARAFGVSHTSVRRYVDLMTDTFMVRQLRPWMGNFGRRVVKSPKVYLSDSGLLHSLLGLSRPEDLAGHPKVGASFEGFALEQVVRRLGARPEECFFWALHSGAELDLLVSRGSRRLGFEFKRTDKPTVTKSMRVAMETLGLERLDVVHAGEHSYPLGEAIRAVPAGRLLEQVRPLS